METEQSAGSSPAPGQAPVRTWLSSSTRGATKTPSDTTSRFDGDGVRYKAKLIGVDMVPDAQGDKMCWDSMMKLKGFEEAVRKQGKHKQRIWVKVSSNGLKIVDERTGAVIHDHDRNRISFLMKDTSDPRALAYIYQYQDIYSLFYIKMANLAEPVLTDIREVCQSTDHKTPEEPAETTTQVSSLLLLNESSSAPPEGSVPEHVFSPQPYVSPEQSNQPSSRNELTEVFSFQMEEQWSTSERSCTKQTESPQPKLSTSQILSMFPVQPVGGSPYSSPLYSPTGAPWGPQGPLGNQWAVPAPVAPWPSMHSNAATWAPVGVTAPPASSQIQAQYSHSGVMWGENTPSSPTTVSGYPHPLNTIHISGATGAVQPVSTMFNHNPHL